MKSLKVLSALFISSALLTSACTPQDKQVGTPEVMAKIRKPKGNKGGNVGTSSGLKIGAYAASTVMMEKQIEALELAQLALGHADVTKSLYSISDKATDEKGVTTLKITSLKEDLNYSNGLGAIKGKMNKAFTVTIATAEDGEIGVEILGQPVKSFADILDLKKTYVNVFEDSYKMVLVTLKDDPSKLGLGVQSSGKFKASSASGVREESFTYVLKMQIDRASLTAPAVSILNSDMAMVLGKDQYAVSAKDLTVKIEGRCNELVGSGVIESDKYKNPVTFNNTSVSVGKKWKQDLATCGHRPTVDIGRLLVY
ncbi:hypothetical protein DOM22_12680 [Bdellovibrio sp. ZAP7]|uniref:hypothetical protein n=1 Tax=Bdellovibrio sp. ZAP7 TaxID=2231053 RepID=UPI001159F2C9|nr:hypothetical protein [Bdellovibrio sp. ZAP7]QDK45945.1 hypothetical protein DOM22_12680 [Bdellovibrio sp. ZAP7]